MKPEEKAYKLAIKIVNNQIKRALSDGHKENEYVFFALNIVKMSLNVELSLLKEIK